MFLRQTYLGKKGMNIRFVHILDGSAESAERRWREISNIVGLDKPPPLQSIRSKGNIAIELNKLIHTGKYGTVVMGKRGFSRIKRWLLGSVSAGVLRRLTDQTLYLID
jgi:2,4-dienoyl-CoA reductase (NADPH2)